jgi:hypothetical protein
MIWWPKRANAKITKASKREDYNYMHLLHVRWLNQSESMSILDVQAVRHEHTKRRSAQSLSQFHTIKRRRVAGCSEQFGMHIYDG